MRPNARPKNRWPEGILLVFGGALALASCGAQSQQVVIFAASSLAPVREATNSPPSTLTDSEPATDPEPATNSEPAAEWVLASSTRLIASVLDGARPDIIISADAEALKDVEAVGYQITTSEPRITNRLVLAVANGNPANISSLDDLALPQHLIGLCDSQVPCGAAAMRLEQTTGLAFQPDTSEPNVRSLAHKISIAELDAGLIYATDALNLGLETIFDERLAPPGQCDHPGVVKYGIAVLGQSLESNAEAGVENNAEDNAVATTEIGAEANAEASTEASTSLIERHLPLNALEQAGFELGQC